MRTIITGGNIITPNWIHRDHDLAIMDSKIEAIEPTIAPGPGDTVIDAGGMWVAPGLIDVHVHGGNGRDTMDATPEAIHHMARFFARHGVTSYFPTTMTDSREATDAAVENMRTCPQPTDGAAHLGVHLEGPYLNPKHKGAQPDTYLRDPDPAEYHRWFDSGVIRLVTIAPERSGGLHMISEGLENGIEFAIGHSDAGFDCVTAAADVGLQQATHTFNGMLGLHHRRPGTLGTVLTDDRIYAQVIADGIHVHPAMVKLLVRAKSPQRTILITDAMRAAGLPDGAYDLGKSRVIVTEGIARIAAGNLAGSTLTMDAALRNVMVFTGLTLQEALPMATAVPAEAMNLRHKGVIDPGADADIIFLDDDLHVALTMVGGRVVFQRD
jgi:N-acetylglucosamine-6-phosphate deacetylase